MKKVKGDTEFSAWAREQQNSWRIECKFPIGTYKQKQKDGTCKDVELGNYIEKTFAFDKQYNFLSDNIRSVVANALKTKEKGAKILKTRLYTNLLSSQPLAFNLFAELSLNLDLATEFLNGQFPNRIKSVQKIIFEHSDGRGDCSYTCDHSAFDVFIEYISYTGHIGFIGIEVKYAESLNDAPAKYKTRYAELTNDSGLFKQNSIQYLKEKPLEQIWRDHLLSISHIRHENTKYAEGFFVYLFPKKNQQCQDAVSKYTEQFISFDDATTKYNEHKTGFYIKHIETFVSDLQQICKEKWLKDFICRYFNGCI
ncbi:MAG TPA: hypothetical protein PKN32_08445 [Bacteroidales bacterium]|nr:hypothetical protein [Bacteroidales bacterium]